MINSPFPGMDPYLEAPPTWPGVHGALITRMAEALMARIAPDYVARMEQRVYITSPGDLDRQSIEPDVYIAYEEPATYAPVVAEGATPPVFVEPAELEPQIVDRFLEIRDVRRRQVVTIIEILSPFNKRTGAQGFVAFQEKRSRVRLTPIHWIEVDLLRAGTRPAEVAGRSDYYVLLKRGDRPRPYEVWFFNLRDRLPAIAVPLLPPDTDVVLDLQGLVDHVYARHGFAYDLAYSQPPPAPSLHPDDAAWCRARIEAWRSA